MCIKEVRSQTRFFLVIFTALLRTGCRKVTHSGCSKREVRLSIIIVEIAFLLHFLSKHYTYIMFFCKSVIPTDNVIPCNDSALSVHLLSQSVIVHTLRIIKSTPVLVFAAFVDIYAQCCLGIDAFTEINLEIRIQVDCLKSSFVYLTCFFIHQCQWIVIIHIRIVSFFIVERRHRRLAGYSRSYRAGHGTCRRQGKTVLSRIAVGCIYPHCCPLEFGIQVKTS